MLLPLKAVISKKTRKDGKSVIYYQYCYSSTNRVLLSTDIAVPQSCWNAKRQCISKGLPSEIGDYEELNRELGRVRKVIETIIEKGASDGVPNIGAYVKSAFAAAMKGETPRHMPATDKKRKEPDFFAEWDSYTASMEKKVTRRVLENFQTTKERLAAFEAHRKEKITFAALDYAFYADMVDFFTYDYRLRGRSRPEFGLRAASLGKTIKQLRMFVKDRVRRKIIPPIDMDDFKIVDEETDAIYLSNEEIGKIYAVDLSHDPTLALYRDMFVLGALTGLRFSDYSTLRGSDLRNGLLYKKANKTDAWVVVPLRKEAAEIFLRHYGTSVPKISNAVFNKRIKVIGALAGLDQPITFSHRKGNRDISVTKPKSEWITSHTCRRSFCTNEYLAGTDISLIMKISGHKTHKEFFKYIRVTQEEAALKIQGIWEARSNMQAFSLRESA